jgi:hypothetical protein
LEEVEIRTVDGFQGREKELIILRLGNAIIYQKFFADPNPHQFGKSDPDPHQCDKLDPDPHHIQKRVPDPHQRDNMDPDSHQSQNSGAVGRGFKMEQ